MPLEGGPASRGVVPGPLSRAAGAALPPPSPPVAGLTRDGFEPGRSGPLPRHAPRAGPPSLGAQRRPYHGMRRRIGPASRGAPGCGAAPGASQGTPCASAPRVHRYSASGARLAAAAWRNGALHPQRRDARAASAGTARRSQDHAPSAAPLRLGGPGHRGVVGCGAPGASASGPRPRPGGRWDAPRHDPQPSTWPPKSQPPGGGNAGSALARDRDSCQGLADTTAGPR
jgi:hypothetical protein